MTLLGHLLTHLPLEYSWLRPTLSEGRRERASGLGARARGERWASRGAVLRPRTRGISVEHARPSAWHTAGRRERQASGGAASACRAPRARPDGVRPLVLGPSRVTRSVRARSVPTFPFAAPLLIPLPRGLVSRKIHEASPMNYYVREEGRVTSPPPGPGLDPQRHRPLAIAGCSCGQPGRARPGPRAPGTAARCVHPKIRRHRRGTVKIRRKGEACTRVCICVSTCVHMCMHMCARARVYVYVCACVRVCVCVCVQARGVGPGRRLRRAVPPGGGVHEEGEGHREGTEGEGKGERR